jgi:hypothetical protein
LNAVTQLMLCSAAADLSRCSRRIWRWCSLTLVSMEWPVCSIQTWPHFQVTLYTPGVSSPRSSFTGQRKLGIFFGGRPTDFMLCLDSSLLMQLKVVLTWGRKVTETGFSGAGATLAGGLRARQISRSLWPFCFKVVLRNSSSLCRLSRSQRDQNLCTSVESKPVCWRDGGESWC